MKTKEEIKRRIELLKEQKQKVESFEYPFHMQDWNKAQLDTAIWYLNWVLQPSECLQNCVEVPKYKLYDKPLQVDAMSKIYGGNDE